MNVFANHHILSIIYKLLILFLTFCALLNLFIYINQLLHYYYIFIICIISKKTPLNFVYINVSIKILYIIF